jgi:hypothetical protein
VIRGHRPWTDEESVALAEMAGAAMPIPAIAEALGRSEVAVAIRIRRRVLCPVDGRVPVFGRGTHRGEDGVRLYWTRERCIEGLRDYARRNRGPLPTSDHVYNQVKKGHPEWPVSARVLEHFGTMADAWEAAGARKGRYSRLWVPWTQEDDDLLLELAGEQTLKRIAVRLNRSWGACKRRLYDLQAGRARDVSGHMSMAQVAEFYACPVTRVKALIDSGELPAKRVGGGHYWRIDPADCERLRDRLKAPKVTHRAVPPDFGDYRRRYGLRRVAG